MNNSTPQEVADSILIRNISGGSDGGRTVRDALRSCRNRVELTPISATQATLDVYQEDDATIAWTATVQLEARNPIGSVDPA